LHQLADLTARFTLIVFAFVTLIRIKARTAEERGVYIAARWVPWAGLASCIGLLAADVSVRIFFDEGGRIVEQRLTNAAQSEDLPRHQRGH
jgi:hypothetical protein